MALSDKEKQYYAWEFLRRSPDYLEFWSSHRIALNSFTGPKGDVRQRRRDEKLYKQKILREDAKRSMGRWCISRIQDPQSSLDEKSLSALFRNLKPVTPFFDPVGR